MQRQDCDWPSIECVVSRLPLIRVVRGASKVTVHQLALKVAAKNAALVVVVMQLGAGHRSRGANAGE